ncbi:hypothetical protein A2U01_0022368 [Trifolium medium]|uniref:Uncharacterized protein n=1 Tax=Trifolium medium TaxID=97028 RepID=A0A392NND6_9FABA|nr:hypothetical protein [Trifolium medium]
MIATPADQVHGYLMLCVQLNYKVGIIRSGVSESKVRHGCDLSSDRCRRSVMVAPIQMTGVGI